MREVIYRWPERSGSVVKLCCLLGRRGITFQGTKTWKEYFHGCDSTGV